jgi:predicted transcriptional regulator
MGPDMDTPNRILELAAEIVAAYVGNNSVAQGELSRLIGDVYKALQSTANGGADRDEASELRPAVAVKKSITPDYLICLEDGKKFKSLKRHLRSHYNLSPEQYREKWNLPADYPMVAPRYAEARSSLAKQMGLGQRAKGK